MAKTQESEASVSADKGARPGLLHAFWGSRRQDYQGYLFIFLLVASIVTGLAWYRVASEYRAVMNYWQARQSRFADDRAHMVSAWLEEHQTSAQLLTGNPAVPAVLRRRPKPNVPEQRADASGAQLMEALDRYAEVYHFTGVYVLNNEERVIARSNGSVELDPSAVSIAREVARTRQAKFDLFGPSPEKSLASVSVPVFAETHGAQPRPVLGVVVLLIDPGRSFFPMLMDEAVPTRTGETVLIRQEGDEAIFISPLRFPPAGTTQLRRPLGTSTFAARAALAAPETSGEFTDYRGAHVLAATRRIPLTGWGLVHKIDREEALKDIRQMAVVEGLVGALLIVLLAGLLWNHRRQALSRASKEQEERFWALLESAPDAMITTNSEGRIVLVNAQTEKLFGLERRGLIGQASGMLLPEWAPVQREGSVPWDFPELVSQHVGRTTEMRGLRKDGTSFPLEVKLSLIETDEGPVLSCGIRDITGRKKAEEEIGRLNANLEKRVSERTAELEAANKELEAFTYSVSHDLRAPLRHIDGFSKLVLEEYGAQLPENAQHYLKRVREGTSRMGQLVDDLLNLARVGRRELSLRLTGLNSLVDDVLRELEPETAGREIDWQVAQLPFVDCDPDLLKQVFANLLSNAAKFTRPREQAVVEVGEIDQDERPVIFIRDNGVGFNMKYADKLFGVFQRLHRSEDFEGTGVGLATVQRIIKKHGGRIWVDAELNKGATFYFTLGASDGQEIGNKHALGGAL